MMTGFLRRLLIGHPLETERAIHERLPKILALPVFASDNLSSVAYATGEMMAALLVVGTGAFGWTLPLSAGIALLLVVVAISYSQTVHAYPTGGGAYIVARENLGILPAQMAGSALLIDYVLTVAVSVSAGVAAIKSLMLTTRGIEIPVVWVSIAAVLCIMVLNLRGARESGTIFAFPTYTFVALLFAVIGLGLWKHFLGGGLPAAHSLDVFRNAQVRPELLHGVAGNMHGVSLFLLLHAFASGCAALTGVEAVSNGVSAFRPPAGRNAAITMAWMATILGISFLGISFLAIQVRAIPETAVGVDETVISQVGRMVLGSGSVLYIGLQVFTALILVLAANTAFADFPRLSAIIARDSFLPRQLANIGDRLVFDRGILVLAALAIALIVGFQANVHFLIPLYAVGVFLSFTLSQTGMVRRWLRLRSHGWRWKVAVNGFGAVCTFIVLLVFGYVKFLHGAWVVIVLIPLMVLMFLRVHAHYEAMRAQLSVRHLDPASVRIPKHAVLVLVPSVTQGLLQAMAYARSLAGEVRGIHIETDPERTPRLREEWMQFLPDVPLIILASPFRSVQKPLMEYLDEVDRETPDTQTTVVLPEFVPNRWWQHLLHGQTGLVLKLALLRRKNVVVTNVRYHLFEESISLREMLDVQREFTREHAVD